MSAGRIILLCMVARVFFVVCCVVLVFSRFGRSELKDPIVPVPKSYNQTYPPVVEAAFKGELNTLKKLLKDDADPNVRSFDNTTAIEFACRNGDDTNSMDVVRELLKYGARARVTDNVGLAPIHQVPAVARLNNRNELIHMLFLHGADLNARTYKQEGGLSLSLNAYDSNKKVTRLNYSKTPKVSYNLLEMMAGNFDRTGIIDLLQNWGGMFPKEDRKQARDWTYDIGFRDIADVFDKYDETKGAWRKNLEKRGLNALMIGTLTNDTELVKKELKNINKTSEDVYRRTPLHMAIMRQYPDIAEILLKAGANVQVKDYRGNTPLHQVAWLGDIMMQKKFTEMLLQYKASFTEYNDRRENIIHHAIRLHDLPYIEYLMTTYKPEQLGLDQKNIEGLTPYYLAEKLNFKEAMKLLPKK